MSKKSMEERLQEKRQAKQRANKGVIAVLAHKEEIAEVLEKGFNMREIYELMVEDGKMPVTYAAFTRLVNKYIKQQKAEATQENEGQPEEAKESGIQREPLGLEQLKKDRGPRKDHVYDENRYDIDDLV